MTDKPTDGQLNYRWIKAGLTTQNRTSAPPPAAAALVMHDISLLAFGVLLYIAVCICHFPFIYCRGSLFRRAVTALLLD